MQNDIQIQQLSKKNQQNDEKLRKMKSNIQKLQMNMNKKQDYTSSLNSNMKKQPITSYNNIKNDYFNQQKRYENPQINNPQQFGYNSNLFRQLNQQNRGVIQNGSALSNFSSVSNINNLLNAGNLLQQQKAQPYDYTKSIGINYKDTSNKIINKMPLSNDNTPNILGDIDRLLQKTKNSKKSTSFKEIQKYTQIKQPFQSKLNYFQSNKTSSIKQQSLSNTNNKLSQYKKLIDSLTPTKNQSNNNNQNDKFYKTDQNYMNVKVEKDVYNKTNFQSLLGNKFDQLNQKEKSDNLKTNDFVKKHKKDEFSNITNKSQYVYNDRKSQNVSYINEQSFIKATPMPPLSNRKSSNNPVQRQKAQIKQSIQQYKKLQNQIVFDDNTNQLDFQLSDDDSQERQQENKKNQQKISKLLTQKQALLKQLEQIDKQLKQLQNQI